MELINKSFRYQKKLNPIQFSHLSSFAMKKIIYYILFLTITANPFKILSQGTLQGVITNTKGEPLTGATVLIKGTNVFAVADNEGKFILTPTQKPPFTLESSFLGFKAREVQVSESSSAQLEITLSEDNLLTEIVITARRRKETAQDVPIPISIISGAFVEEAGAFNVNRVKEFIPSVQLYTSNPRNTGINIRGIGSPFGLTNDGLDPGVGIYVDGV